MQKATDLKIEKIEDNQAARFLLKQCQQTQQELEATRVSIVKPFNDFVGEVNTLFKGISAPILESKAMVNQKIVAHAQKQERIRLEEERKRFAAEQARLRKLEEERQERERIEREKREAEEKALAEERERLRKLEEEQIAKEMEAQKASEEEKQKVLAEAERQRKEREALEQEKLEVERLKREAEEERKRIDEEKALEEQRKIAEQERVRKEQENKVKGIVKSWQWEIVDENSVPRAFCTPDSKKINQAIKTGIREINGLRIFEATTVR